MIKTDRNRNQVRRWIDINMFVQKNTTTSYQNNNNLSNLVSLYDYVLSRLSRQGGCDNWSGDLLTDFDIFLPSSAFLTGSNKNRTANRNLDLYSVVNTIISNEDLCDLPFDITAETYTVDYLKTLFFSMRNDVNEVSKAYATWPQGTPRVQSNDAVSLKTIIDAYADDIRGIYSLPTITVTIDHDDPDEVTVLVEGTEADGVTNLNVSGEFYMWVTFNGETRALNEGNLISWGDTISVDDRQYMQGIGIGDQENIGGGGNGDYNQFQFVKNEFLIQAWRYPITFTVRGYEDPGLSTEKFTYRVEDTCPVLGGGLR